MEFVLQPGNPHDWDDLDEMRTAVEEQFGGVTVRVERASEGGYGVTLEEVLHVFQIAGEVGTDITNVATPLGFLIHLIRARVRKERSQKPSQPAPRKRTVVLYAPDGRALKRVEVSDPDDEPFVDDAPSESRTPPCP